MTWQKKHDIILSWIDSCKTMSQLQNLVPFVKSQEFEIDGLLLIIRLKGLSLYGDFLVDNGQQMIKVLTR
jgi:hypothetical protein